MNQASLVLSLRECQLSDWYASPEDHRCPHDAWVEAVTISEPASGERNQERELQIQIRLLGAYHDGIIEFTYRRVQHYSLQMSGITGHGDWIRDEIEDGNGFILHTVSFAHGSFNVQASEAEYRWTPLRD